MITTVAQQPKSPRAAKVNPPREEIGIRVARLAVVGVRIGKVAQGLLQPRRRQLRVGVGVGGGGRGGNEPMLPRMAFLGGSCFFRGLPKWISVVPTQRTKTGSL